MIKLSQSGRATTLSRGCLIMIGITLPFIALGCGGGANDKPELGTVSGVVTLGGDPLPEARVVFAPEEGGQSSEAVTDAQGHYELRYRGEEMGAKIGKHKVYVSTFEQAELDDSGKPMGGKEELVPEKYNTNTTLILNVKEGENDIPLTLEK